MTAFSYTLHPTDRQLHPWVRGVWEFTVAEGAPATHHVPPDGLAFVVMVERGAQRPLLFAYGPRIEPLVVETAPGARYRGLRVAPEAAPQLVEVSADLLQRGGVPLQRLGPVAGNAIIDALLSGPPHQMAAAIDALFLPLQGRLPATDPVVAAALEMIRDSRGHARIIELAGSLRLSPRTLLRRVRTATGLTPKQHARIARFLAAAHGLLDPGHRLSEVAARAGYADQPHFHHEVESLTGLTPAELSHRVRHTAHRLDD